MGIHHTVILLLVLCASQNYKNFIRYKKFIRQHVFGAMNVQRCDSEICTSRDPKMTTAAKKSTPSLANNNQVKAVCTGGGTRLPENRDLYMSNKPFPVITLNTEDTSPLERLLWGVQVIGQRIMKKAKSPV
uniref:Uncharacterized protein n=1 Tax=Sinocyclocheilus anshuiensis TaxID=1608454 RepID=A0A671LUN7_9TELE